MGDSPEDLTVQQRDLLAEFYARELASRGAQTVHDFSGFTTRAYSRRRWLLSETAVRREIVRLKNRGLIQIVFGGRPKTYGLTGVGRDIARLIERPEETDGRQ